MDRLFRGFWPAFFLQAAVAGFREIVLEFVSPVVPVVCYPAVRPFTLKARAHGKRVMGRVKVFFGIE